MKSKRYNLLYLDSGSGIGGGQRSLLLLLKYLDKTRFCPFVGCSPDSMLAAEARKAGHVVIPLVFPEAHDKTDRVRRFTFGDLIGDLRLMGVIRQLLRLMREKRISLIHANSLAAALIGSVAAKLGGVPIILHKRYATSYGLLDRIGEKLVDTVILVSKATRWNFARRSKQVLIYNGVELDAFRAAEEEVEAVRTNLNLSGEDVVAGVVTRITPEKGIHLLIEAMAQLRAQSQIKLIIVGGPYFSKDTDYLNHLKAQTRKLGVTNQVIFTGFLADTRAITVLLDMMSSLRNSETRIIVEFAKNVESLHPPRLCFLKPNLSTRRMQDVTDSAQSQPISSVCLRTTEDQSRA